MRSLGRHLALAVVLGYASWVCLLFSGASVAWSARATVIVSALAGLSLTVLAWLTRPGRPRPAWMSPHHAAALALLGKVMLLAFALATLLFCCLLLGGATVQWGLPATVIASVLLGAALAAWAARCYRLWPPR